MGKVFVICQSTYIQGYKKKQEHTWNLIFITFNKSTENMKNYKETITGGKICDYMLAIVTPSNVDFFLKPAGYTPVRYW